MAIVCTALLFSSAYVRACSQSVPCWKQHQQSNELDRVMQSATRSGVLDHDDDEVFVAPLKRNRKNQLCGETLVQGKRESRGVT